MLAVAMLLLFAARAAWANDWFFIPEPRFMEHEISFPVSGAKDTVLAPSRWGDGALEFPTVAVWQANALSQEIVAKVTARFASEWLAHTKIEIERNAKNVIEYAVLRGEKFPVCATVFAPEFRKQFEEIFGPKLLVVIPNRQTVFVFPGIAGNVPDFVPMILEAWRSTSPKVSLEVFELTEGGLKATGHIAEP